MVVAVVLLISLPVRMTAAGYRTRMKIAVEAKIHWNIDAIQVFQRTYPEVSGDMSTLRRYWH